MSKHLVLIDTFLLSKYASIVLEVLVAASMDHVLSDLFVSLVLNRPFEALSLSLSMRQLVNSTIALE